MDIFLNQPDPETVKKWYLLYAKDLYRFALVLCREREMAADLVHDTYLTVLKTEYPPENEAVVKKWLMRVLHNRYRDAMRHLSVVRKWLSRFHEPLFPLMHPATRSPEQHFEEQELFNTLWMAIQRLPPKYRSVIYLYYIEDFNVNETAGILGIPGKTVMTRLFRARKRLMKILDAELHR